MDIVVQGRHCNVSDTVKEQVVERISTVERFRDRVQRVEVEFTVEPARRGRDQDVIAEITLRSKGPVVRAEGLADDKLAAFDKAMERLKTQLRKAQDRRKHHHHGLRTADHFGAPLIEAGSSEGLDGEHQVNGSDSHHTVAGLDVIGDGPLVVKEKEFSGAPLTLAQALDEMELVGHDFFLYSDAESGRPSVVYRRKGYDYGVIHLDVRNAS
ncbi:MULTISPECIES: ribosome hibernation-promoting factor, HPF/YfiA family [Aestuariimicrobium]|uniref:ribosome hibernation-promoting factor, HPF/YfiA family n=1 Tax=Aestuariimicrobium TaxID=396388 RepID=UPI00040C1F4D|nr:MULTISPECIES: ribosome-associated translation inhibitor RaiA [Aestuariimicrobium]CAI9410877.1 Ribosome hibernation promotion factor [Aestuariimicrobium sp. T2.26MG-19.2B]